MRPTPSIPTPAPAASKSCDCPRSTDDARAARRRPSNVPHPCPLRAVKFSKKSFPAFPRQFPNPSERAARPAHIPRNRAGNTEGPRNDDDVHETDDDGDDHDRPLVGCWTLDVERWMFSIAPSCFMSFMFHVSCFPRTSSDTKRTRKGPGLDGAFYQLPAPPSPQAPEPATLTPLHSKTQILCAPRPTPRSNPSAPPCLRVSVVHFFRAPVRTPATAASSEAPARTNPRASPPA